MNYKLGFTEDNCNNRCTNEQLEDRVKITAEETDGTTYEYYFKVPGLWTNVIIDYLKLVTLAHPTATVEVEY